MTERSLVQASTAGSHEPTALRAFEPISAVACYHLAWCMPLLFAIGTSTLLMTRVLFGIYHPAGFVGTLPTISETAAHDPGATFFQYMAIVIAPCAVSAWFVIYAATRQRLAAGAVGTPGVGGIAVLNTAASALGMTAGITLVLLGSIKLHAGDWPHFLHLQLSKLFYVSQVAAFVFESSSALWQRRLGLVIDRPVERTFLRLRLGIAMVMVGGSLWFLFLYVDREALGDRQLGQQIYVATEYVLGILCFTYAATCFAETRKHFRARAAAT